MHTNSNKPIFSWSRYGGYECSTQGDKRLSAFNARLADGRTIEMHYQLDIKLYDPGGTDWRKGKGRPPLDPSKDLYAEYKELWRQWVLTHPDIFREVANIALTHHNGVLSDMFAKTPVNQARALSDLMNEYLTPKENTMSIANEQEKSSITVNTQRVSVTTTAKLTLSGVFPECKYYANTVTTDTHVYVLGGMTLGRGTCTVFYASILEDGSLGPWLPSRPLPCAILKCQTVVIGDYLHLIGGVTNGEPTSKVYSSKIAVDGSLGPWTIDDSLPSKIAYAASVVTKNKVYLLGGISGDTPSAKVYSSTFTEDGKLGPWVNQKELPMALYNVPTIVTGNTVHMFSCTLNNKEYKASYSAKIDKAGNLGKWVESVPVQETIFDDMFLSTKGNLTHPRAYGLSYVVHYKSVYAVSGFVGHNTSNLIFSCPFTEDGVLGAWTEQECGIDIPLWTNCITTKGHIHVLPILDKKTMAPHVYSAKLSLPSLS